MNALLIAFALVTPVNKLDVIIPAPVVQADPYIYRPWEPIEILEATIKEQEDK